MAVHDALTRFPPSILGLLPGLGKERIGLWSSFPGPRLDSVGTVSYLVISDTPQNDFPQPVALLCRALPQLLREPQERLQRSFEAQSTWYPVVLLGRPRHQRPDHVCMPPASCRSPCGPSPGSCTAARPCPGRP